MATKVIDQPRDPVYLHKARRGFVLRIGPPSGQGRSRTVFLKQWEASLLAHTLLAAVDRAAGEAAEA